MPDQFKHKIYALFSVALATAFFPHTAYAACGAISGVTGTNSLVVSFTDARITPANLVGATQGLLVYDASAKQLKLCDGDNWVPLASANSIAAAGSTGSVQFKGAGNTLAGTNLLTWDNTNDRLGIGTSSPATSLHIIGNSILQNLSALSSNNAMYNIISFRDSAGTEYGWLGDGSTLTNYMTLSGSSSHPVALITSSQVRVFANASGGVGIHTNNPTSPLHVVGNTYIAGDLTVDAGAIIFGTPPASWTTVGWRPIMHLSQGQAILWNKISAGVARGIGASSNGNFYISRSDANDNSQPAIYDMIIDNSGNYGIGGTPPNPSYKMDIAGSVRLGSLAGGGGSNFHIDSNAPTYGIYLNYYSTGNVYARSTLLASSDARLKKNVEVLPSALDKIAAIRGVSFEWTDEARTGKQIGVIAQDVEAVYPELVMEDEQGYKTVAYSNLVAPLIEAVKTLKAENEALRARIEALEASND